MCLASLTFPFAVVFAGAHSRGSVIGKWTSAAIPVLMLVLLGYLRVARRASTRFVTVASIAVIASIVTTDFVNSAEIQVRIWPAAIVLIDVLLVAQVDESGTICIVAFMCGYLTFVTAEQWLRFGLYDLPGLAPYDTRECQGGCDEPPCARTASAAGSMLSTNLLIFLLDFYFTRGFALQVRREKDKIAAAVTTAEQVAERLASLDLDAAEAVLRGSEDVPPGLCESLYTILSHLKGYKPFLPQAVILPAAYANEARRGSSMELSTELSGDIGAVFSDAHSSVSQCSGPSRSSHGDGRRGARDVGEARPFHEASTFHLVVKRLSLLRLHPSLPVVSDTTFLASHSQVLEAVLKQAVSCKGVVDHFCGDVVSLSYNASASCVRHPMMAVQTAAALCLNKSHGACELRGAVVTGKAHVGVLGVPELRRHCIVGRLATVCRNIGEGAGILGHRLLCSHTTAVDVACVQATRVLLDRFVFEADPQTDICKEASDVVHEVVPSVALDSVGRSVGPSEWMYELAQLSTDEWDVYNKAGCAFVCEGNGAAALKLLHSSGASKEHVALFDGRAAAARVLDFTTRSQLRACLPS